ncbi:MAG: DMT family transporter [Wenzhouxiangella sp.]|jgi:drug/metabolite transporter (DMT)-like permease|nr:DMT family transporter [Wenzhouxiangella sp.]
MKTPVLVALALIAFAANSILNRLALTDTAIDPVTFTTVRILAGALMLAAIVRLRAWWLRSREQPVPQGRGSLISALALLAYACLFSLAYVELNAASGALLLFGAVQISMVGWTLIRGERLTGLSSAGFALALSGLVWLLLPGLARPPLWPALMMIGAGVAWAVYTLRAGSGGDPTASTAGNFLLASAPTVLLALAFRTQASWDSAGLGLAIASGALASGLGYVIWYAALARIRTQTAAVAQLQVPVLTALAGVGLLGEPLSLRLVLAGATILAGVLLVIAPWRARR